MILPIIIVAGVLLLGAAVGVHAAQVAREKLAQRRQRAADARAAEAAAREAAAAAEDMRRSRNPQHYISVQRSRINRLLAPLRERLRQRNAELDQLRTDLADAPPSGSLWRRLLAGRLLGAAGRAVRAQHQPARAELPCAGGPAGCGADARWTGCSESW